MSTVISIYNAKGGVGKTTSTLNIGAALARSGNRVLLIDTDRQSNLSLCFKVDPYIELSLGAVLLKAATIEQVIQHHGQLDLIPSAKYMNEVVKSINGVQARERLLRKALKAVDGLYDYILIDCAPSSNLITENALTASQYVITPLEAKYFAVDGINSILDDIDEIRENLNEDLQLGGIFLNEYHEKMRNSIAQGFAQALKAGPVKDLMFNTYIRSDSNLDRSVMFIQDIFSYKPESNAAVDFTNLTKEILIRCPKTKTPGQTSAV